MTLQDLSSIGEIVGAIAVVVSLVYLAIQVRQNTYRYHLMLQARSVEPLEYRRAILQIERLAQVPGFRSWWSRQRRYFEFDLEFCRMVDEQVTAYSP